MESLLEGWGLTKRFGGVAALQGVELAVAHGEIVGLIGPNGSGKTTLINTINGVLKPDAGTIRLRGEPMTSKSPALFARAGVTRTFQTARVFQEISVEENMLTAALHLRTSKAELLERANRLLHEVQLDGKRELGASELSGGQQKLLEFARAMMTNPDLVLMDEPFAGVHPNIKKQILKAIRTKHSEGTAFVIVSHEIPVLMSLAERVMCLDDGATIAAGTPAEIREDDAVVEAYLGHVRDEHKGERNDR